MTIEQAMQLHVAIGGSGPEWYDDEAQDEIRDILTRATEASNLLDSAAVLIGGGWELGGDAVSVGDAQDYLAELDRATSLPGDLDSEILAYALARRLRSEWEKLAGIPAAEAQP